MMKILFWSLIFLVFFTYIGYGLLLYLLLTIKRIFEKETDPFSDGYVPDVTFVVAAYNEEHWIEDKVRNCLAFDYPKDKIVFLFVTDGSSEPRT